MDGDGLAMVVGRWGLIPDMGGTVLLRELVPIDIAKRGVEAAVLVRVDEWHRLQTAARPSLKQLLLADEPRFAPLAKLRGQARRRRIEPLG